MEALQSLQLKIRRLESDRVQAEDNLKSLATETSDYKQLLRQKQVLDQSNSSADSHSKGKLIIVAIEFSSTFVLPIES